MAFHVACPITCRRICDCELGFPASLRGGGRRAEFADEIARLEEFLRDPWCLRPGDTVQVAVPRVEPPPVAPAEDAEEAAAASAKRSAMQHQAAAASLAAEDYVRRLEAVGAAEVQGEEAREDQVSSAAKVMCRICFSGESDGSEKAVKMLSCKFCSKKYHRSCLKSWAEHRDLFNWSSWACPSCRICEICRRSGDPNRLMYCKRCDAAYHCYCQQPSHKNVSHGPYLCPKHTRCHSCGSNVPGSGLSTRWFLGYTCCDACGRLFSKGNYCPVCLKVYRDSEITPMVCCDVCQKWVHCQCDGISDEKYQEFQADQNLLYKCATCRGNCYKVRDLDDAVRELWKRKDEADRDLIATLRVAAGLPPQQENISASPYSDDEQSGPVLKKDYAQPLKLSVKGLSDKSAKNVTETKLLSPSKKNFKKKGYQIKFVHKSEDSCQNVERQYEARSFESCFGDNKIGGLDGPEVFSSSAGSKNGKFVREAAVNNFDRVSTEQSKGKKLQDLQIKESAGKIERKSDSSQRPKLVIHLGAKARNASNSPRSESSSCHRDQDISASYGREDTKKPKAESRENGVLGAHGGVGKLDGAHGGVGKLDGAHGGVGKLDDGRGARFDDTNQSRHSKHGHREKSIVKLGKVSDLNGKRNNNVPEEAELAPIREMPSVKGKRSRNSDFTRGTVAEGTQRNEEPLLKKQLKFTSGNLQSESHETSQSKLIPNASSDLRPLLKLKFKNPYFEQRSSWAPNGEEENSVKGQRSKRKRPSGDKNSFRESVSYGLLHPESQGDEAMEAKILLKLGKGAVGKRIEVHQSSDNSWRPGVVSGTIEGSSSLIVQLDDGATTTLELGRQGVRFVEQKKQKKAHR